MLGPCFLASQCRKQGAAVSCLMPDAQPVHLIPVPDRKEAPGHASGLGKAVRPASGAVNDGENLDVVVDDAIWNDIRRFCDHQFADPRDPSGATKMRMIAQPVDRIDDAHDDAVGGVWIVAGDEVADRFQIGQGRSGPPRPQSFAEYFLRTRATSWSSAKSPRSAASIPAPIFPICHALSAI